MKVKKKIFFQAFICIVIFVGLLLTLAETTKVLYKDFVKPTPKIKALPF